MNEGRPYLASDFATLAPVAARLHADRIAALPDGDPRVASMASIAAILEAARHGRAIGAVAGTWAALRADLADTSRRAADRATRARGDLQAQETADALAAIAWHFEPVSPAIDTPQIVFCQAATLAIRAKLAGDRASPAPTQLPPPSRQRPVQPGPLFGAAA